MILTSTGDDRCATGRPILLEHWPEVVAGHKRLYTNLKTTIWLGS